VKRPHYYGEGVFRWSSRPRRRSSRIETGTRCSYGRRTVARGGHFDRLSTALDTLVPRYSTDESLGEVGVGA
jgi:hypothetical protein